MKAKVLLIILLIPVMKLFAQDRNPDAATQPVNGCMGYTNFIFTYNGTPSGCDPIFNNPLLLMNPWQVSHGDPQIVDSYNQGFYNIGQLTASYTNFSYLSDGIMIAYNFQKSYVYSVDVVCRASAQSNPDPALYAYAANLQPQATSSCVQQNVPTVSDKIPFFVNQIVNYEYGAFSDIYGNNITMTKNEPNLWIYLVTNYSTAAIAEIISVNITCSGLEKVPPTPPKALGETSITNCSALLYWTAATDNVGVQWYRIYNNGVLIATIPGTSTSYQLSGLTTGTVYNGYSILAVDYAGNISTLAYFPSFTTTSTPTPSPKAMDPTNIGLYTATLNWGAVSCPCFSGYAIFNNGNFVANTTNPSYNLTNLTVCTTYSGYTVEAIAAGLYSAPTSLPSFTTPSLNAAAYIDGQTYLCTSCNYTVDNLYPGTSVTWSPLNGPIEIITLTNQPTVEIVNLGTYPTTSPVTVTLNLNGCIDTRTIEVENSYGNSSTQTGSVSQPACLYNGHQYQGYTGALTYPTYLSSYCLANVTLNDMNDKVVTFTGTTQPIFWSYTYNALQNTGSLFLELPPLTGAPFSFTVSGGCGCSDRHILFFTEENYQFNIHPNPVTDFLFIDRVDQDGNQVTSDINKPTDNQPITFSIYDATSSQLFFNETYNPGNVPEKIDVSKLNIGVYILKIIDKNQVQTLKFIKN